MFFKLLKDLNTWVWRVIVGLFKYVMEFEW
jgi:hypothetical protein